MEQVRRCEECRRVVPGHAGDACPYCGSAKLSIESYAAEAPLHHPAIFTLALTFCGGLLVVWSGIRMLAPQWLPNSPGQSELLWNLQVLIGAATALYIVLRRGEGDFRALFIVSLGLFAGAEGLGALIRSYGLTAMGQLAGPFNVALFVFSSLGLSAGVADGQRRDRYQPALLAADCGMMFLAALRAVFELRSRHVDERATRVTTIALAVVTLAVVALLARSEWRKRGAAQKETETAATAAGNGEEEE